MKAAKLNLNFNERRILEFLRINGPTSRADLAKQANLKPPTLTRLTSTLLEAKLIKDVKIQRVSTPGQPPRLLGINPEGLYTVGIAITPDEVNICIVDLIGDTVAYEAQKLDSYEVEPILEETERLFQKLLQTTKVKKSKLLGCGVTMPGYFSKRSPYIVHIPQFKSWSQLDISKMFSDKLDIRVWHDNDGNAATLSEAYYGVGRGVKEFVNIHLTYGIGGGAVIDGKFYRGTHGNVAEFGYFFPLEQERPSGTQMMEFLQKKGFRFNSLSELSLTLEKTPILNPWLESSTQHLLHLINIIHYTFDPTAIIISGILPKWILTDLVERINARHSVLSDLERTPPQILASEFDKQSQRIGAASIPLYHCLSPENYTGRALRGW